MGTNNFRMVMSSNSQLVMFDTLFVIVAEFECSYIELNFLHVTIKAGEGGGPLGICHYFSCQYFREGEEKGNYGLWTMSLILQFFLKSFLILK